MHRSIEIKHAQAALAMLELSAMLDCPLAMLADYLAMLVLTP